MTGRAKQPKKQLLPQWDNPLEALKSLGSDLGKSVKNDLIAEGWEDVLEQFSLRPPRRISGTLSSTETLNLAELEKQRGVRVAQPELVLKRERTETFLYTQETQEIAQKISEIQWELKRLVASSQQLAVEFKEVTMETVPAKPGVYHVNFFEWLLSLIKNIREKIEDSCVWLRAFQSKKAKRGYWAMFKKHGTSFGLSNERMVATQTG